MKIYCTGIFSEDCREGYLICRFVLYWSTYSKLGLLIWVFQSGAANDSSAIVCYALSVGEYLFTNIRYEVSQNFISTIRQPDKSDLLGLFDPKEEGTTLLRKVSNYLLINPVLRTQNTLNFILGLIYIWTPKLELTKIGCFLRSYCGFVQGLPTWICLVLYGVVLN